MESSRSRGSAGVPNPPAVQVVAGAEPFAADGAGPAGSVGVLVSHGFTGSPYSMRPWAEQLAAAGYTVRLPRLPGHGTSWQELNAHPVDRLVRRDPGGLRRTRRPLRHRDRLRAVDGRRAGHQARRGSGRPPGVGKLAGLVLVNPAIGTLRRDAQLAKLHRLGGAARGPASATTSRRPGVLEHGYDRTPLRALVSMMAMWKLIVADLRQDHRAGAAVPLRRGPRGGRAVGQAVPRAAPPRPRSPRCRCPTATTWPPWTTTPS